MIKSPLRYPGGKSRAVETISRIIPVFDEFREPFFGGGSVFFYAKQRFPQKLFWVNDLYFELYTFWDATKKNCAELIAQIEMWKAQFSIGKDLYRFLNKNMSQFTDLERAAAFFVYNRITFSGTSLSGGFSEAAFTGRFTKSSIQRLHSASTILQNTAITNNDYSELIYAKGRNVFLFLDPPYYSATKSALYGKKGNLHTNFDHQLFAQTMKNCRHTWLVTYDDSEYIRSLFSFANVYPWNLTYGMRNVSHTSNQIGKEIFISNYPLKLLPQKQPELFEFESVALT